MTAMSFPEYMRLRYLYEAAFVYCGPITLTEKKRQTDLSSQELATKHELQQERHAARGRVTLHKQTCPTCAAAVRWLKTPTKEAAH